MFFATIPRVVKCLRDEVYGLSSDWSIPSEVIWKVLVDVSLALGNPGAEPVWGAPGKGEFGPNQDPNTPGSMGGYPGTPKNAWF